MKFRTDFVTNSSSSSFITITVTMKDGSVITNELETGGGFPKNQIIFCNDLSMIVNSDTQSGDDVLRAIQKMYEDMGIDSDIENNPQPLSEITDFQSSVKKITIKENVAGDIMECFDSILTASDEEEVYPEELTVEMSYDVKKKTYSKKKITDDEGQKVIIRSYDSEEFNEDE